MDERRAFPVFVDMFEVDQEGIGVMFGESENLGGV